MLTKRRSFERNQVTSNQTVFYAPDLRGSLSPYLRLANKSKIILCLYLLESEPIV